MLDVSNGESWDIDKCNAYISWLNDQGVKFFRDDVKQDGMAMAHLAWEYVLHMPWEKIEKKMMELPDEEEDDDE